LLQRAASTQPEILKVLREAYRAYYRLGQTTQCRQANLDRIQALFRQFKVTQDLARAIDGEVRKEFGF
jgi:hypothetical protein